MSERSERPVLFVGSSGGHLAQLMALRPWWQGRKRRWVTFDTPDAVDLLADEDVVWAHHPTTRNIPNLLRNSVLALSMVRDRPSLVVSTGAGVALPYFVVARALGVPTIYIEVFDRLDSLTLTAKLCKPFTSAFLVQWDEQLALTGGSTMIGPLL